MNRPICSVARVYGAAFRLKYYHFRCMTSLALSPHLLVEEDVTYLEKRAEQKRSASDTSRRARESSIHLSPAYFTSRGSEFARREIPSGDVVQCFRVAIKEQDLTALHTTYNALRQQKLLLQQGTYASSHTLATSMASITAEELRSAMQLAAGPPKSLLPISSRTKKERDLMEVHLRSQRDGELVQIIFEDLWKVFGFDINSSDCSLSVSGMILQEVNPIIAFHHLQYLCSSFNFHYRSSDISSVMHLCSRNNDVGIAQRLWRMIKKARIKIEYLLRDQYLHILLRTGKVIKAENVAFHGEEGTRIYADKNAVSFAWFLEAASRAGLAQNRQLEGIAMDLLEQVKEASFPSTLFHWHALIVYYGLVKGAPAAMQLICDAIRDGQIEADSKTFNILLLCHDKDLDRIASMGSEDDVLQLFNRIQEKIKVQPDKFSYSIGICTLLGKRPTLLYSSAIDLSNASTQSGQETDRKGLIAALSEENFILQGNCEEKDRSSFSIPRNTPGQINEAKLLYQTFRSHDQLPDKVIAEPLIRAYTTSYLPFLTDAITVYDDLRLYLREKKQRRSNFNAAKVGQDIYDLLLVACANARDPITASRLIQDMVQDDVVIGHSNAANFTILLLQSSTTYEEAFQAYENMKKAAIKLNQKLKSKIPFERSGMLQIISCFSKLRLEDQTSPPIHLLLSMVSDMKVFNFPFNAKLFTTLLRFYGYLSITSPRDRHELQYNVVEMHAYIQRENVEPDLTLVTALMDAYNRVGLTQQALEIWHRLILNDSALDYVCIAVALDTCGFGGKLSEVRRAWKWVRSRPSVKEKCNKVVWDAYIEALARCDQLQEAIEIVFGEMRNELDHRQEGESVDAKTMEMLLRFSSSKKHCWKLDMDGEYPLLSMVQQRMQNELPEVWEQVKNVHIPRHA